MNQSKFLDRIIEYSKFSAIFVLLKSPVNAQVVYTDIDPDMVFDESPEGSWFDIDENGTLDIGLQNYSFTVYSFSLQETSTFQFLIAFRYDSQNAIAGFADTEGTCYPSALSQGYIVKASINWQTALTQFLATNRYHSGVPVDNCTYCDWYNESIPETIDHYLGIRFVDGFGLIHYGWIRCDVLDEGKTLVVKDYAYEIQVDYPIRAGDTISYIDDIDSMSGLNANVYSYNKDIYISLAEPVETILSIWNLNGAKIIQRKINSPNEIISMSDFSAGTYLIGLGANDKSYMTKIIIK